MPSSERTPGYSEASTPTRPSCQISFHAYRALVRDQFERNVRFWSGDRLPGAFPLASDDFFRAWEAEATLTDVFRNDVALGGPIALGFVDGDHSYEQARRDFLNLDCFLRPGGFILFDDSDPFGAFPQVYEVVKEALRGNNALAGENPQFLVRKRD